MFELVGKYTSAKVYADICETEAQAQIVQLCNHPQHFSIFLGEKSSNPSKSNPIEF